MQFAIAQHECRARKFCRKHSIAEPQLVTQSNGRRLLHEQRIRACIDDELADTLGDDDPAGTVLPLEDHD